MAMIVSALVSQLADTLAAFAKDEVSTMLKDEVAMLLGAKRDLQRLEQKLGYIRPFLEDAERRAFTDDTVRSWLAALKSVAYDADDVIDYSRTHAERLAMLSARRHSVRCCSHMLASYFRRVELRHRMGGRIRSINERLEWIKKDQSDFNLIPAAAAAAPRDDRGVHRRTDPLLEPDIVGSKIEDDTDHLVGLCTREESAGRPTIQVLAIVGMGGIGKTTLARKIYNHQAIRDNFRMPPPMWVCVSQDFNGTDLLKEVIRSAGGDPEGSPAQSLPLLLARVIRGRKLFLVLDDVWNTAGVWENLLQTPLLNGAAAGSWILITTRDEGVARGMWAVHLHTVQPMSPDDGWALLRRMVFGRREEEGGGGGGGVRDVGVQIVQRCDGLPLAIKAIAGVLRAKEPTRREWVNVLSDRALSLKGGPLPQGVMGVLYLSYQDLPSHLKQCFIYCSLFPEDYVFKQPQLVELWVAQGFVKEEVAKEGGNMMMSLEEVGEEYYKDLIRRSLLQPDPNSYANVGCKMHDLLRSLAQFLARDEIFSGDMKGLSMKAAESSSMIMLRHVLVAGDDPQQKPNNVLKYHKRLRTLSNRHCDPSIFRKMGSLRVLDLSGSDVEKLPESGGNLIHLRLLNLSHSPISELPDTIGSLSNLQYLILQECKNLCYLPRGVAKLYNLRALDLHATPMSSFPEGIGSLQHLNKLTGFTTNECIDDGRRRGWCSLEELGTLSRLRILEICNLERALIRGGCRGGRGVPLLKDKLHLYDLTMHCASCRTEGQPYDEEDVKQIQEVFQEELFPPPSIEIFKIDGYFGLQLPSWMMTSSIVSDFCNLTRLDFVNCQLCKNLPPLGLLPNLDYLVIDSADAVESIGPEFFFEVGGGGAAQNPSDYHRGTFCKLEKLYVQNMPNWVEWLWDAAEDGGTTKTMPCLKYLTLVNCPNLRCLPTGLRQTTMLQHIVIAGANSLGVIENFVSVKDLTVESNPNLVRISNLPALQELTVDDCPALKEVEGLHSLNRLELTDTTMDILPDWLLPNDGGWQHSCFWLLANTLSRSCDFRNKHPFPALAKLYITVAGAHVLQRCLEGGPDWPKIQHFPEVHIQADGRPEFVRYTRDPYSFRTNLDASGSGGTSHGTDADRPL